MKYLHTMVRVTDLEKSIAFYKLLGLEEIRRHENEKGRYTLVFMAAPGDHDAAGIHHDRIGRRAEFCDRRPDAGQRPRVDQKVSDSG